MRIPDGRPDHIQDYLVQLHLGPWFQWTDIHNKVYSNLKLTEKVWKDEKLIDNTITELPTEKECTDGLAALQAVWDLENNSYKSKRRAVYPSYQEQLDMQYWDKKNGTTTWVDAITKIKTDNPKL